MIKSFFCCLWMFTYKVWITHSNSNRKWNIWWIPSDKIEERKIFVIKFNENIASNSSDSSKRQQQYYHSMTYIHTYQMEYMETDWGNKWPHICIVHHLELCHWIYDERRQRTHNTHIWSYIHSFDFFTYCNWSFSSICLINSSHRFSTKAFILDLGGKNLNFLGFLEELRTFLCSSNLVPQESRSQPFDSTIQKYPLHKFRTLPSKILCIRNLFKKKEIPFYPITILLFHQSNLSWKMRQNAALNGF